MPVRLNLSGDSIENGKLHEIALYSILVEQSKRYQAFVELQSSTLSDKNALILCFGPERCVPPSVIRKIESQLIHVEDLENNKKNKSQVLPEPTPPPEEFTEQSDQRIAVTGMSCVVPGASDLESFSKLLRIGESQHVEVPENRFTFETAWRDLEPNRKWYGNFIEDYDSFDHKFFKKSPREMASTDPQHRLILQVAYQAVEQSGYFRSTKQDKHIGCYMGVGLVDYENNIACHPANAYSATGNLKSFAAGRISM